MGGKIRRTKSILVIDDDLIMLQLMKDALEPEGYDVTLAADGVAGVALLRETDPDMVLLDIMMPGTDGLEILNSVRQHYEIPVIMLTAKRDVGTLRDALIHGADDYIRKPFNKLELIARIKAKLGHIYL